MKFDDVKANVVTFNLLLSGLCGAGRMKKTKKVFREMQARDGKVDQAEEILKKVMENGLVPTCVVSNTPILSGQCGFGDMEKALLTIAIITSNSVINKFCDLGDMVVAEEWVKENGSEGNLPKCADIQYFNRRLWTNMPISEVFPHTRRNGK